MIVETAGDGGAAVAMPILIGSQLRGAVSVLTSDGDTRGLIERMQMAIGWFEAAIRRQRATGSENLATVIELLATSLHHKRFSEAATAVASELSGALGCELVAVGLIKRGHCRVRALSNSATFGKRANLIRAIEAAMDEAIDQQAVISYPPPNDAPDRVLRAHKTLSDLSDGAGLCCVPLTEQGKITGALLLQNVEDTHFDVSAVNMAEHAAVLVGPILDIKRREDRWLPAKTWDAFGNLLGAIFGRGHAALKLSILVIGLFIAFCWYAVGPYRVTTDAVIEGRVQRVVTAPLAGFITDALVRAGDTVVAGDVMARLDDRDIRLERLKWTSERTKQALEYSEALAQRDRARARILASQIEQSDAQIALLDQQLERMNITSPLDGIVVSGDLTQALGAPIERGEVLFQVAPLEDYRVILRIDERDIRDIYVGQTGPLILSALPDTPYEINVERITTISSVESGANFFLVEASVLDGSISDLRPGMEGIAKIDVDERRLISIWTRKIVLWGRMKLWSWWP
ncbi:MAG: efflux RND transporter periplasmic adaptor subunit [Yoonia sp.]|uniref:efflux RND transporter periplasmic adaptor subunit n=1 Tax=Yoonia sp. TaxID=2212373 RepID=UPI003EF1ED19